MRRHLIGAALLGAAAVLGSAGAAHADLTINPVPATTDVFRTETGQSIPTGTGGYVGGTLSTDSSTTLLFTFGPLGLVAGATGFGDSANVNEFWVGSDRATAETLGQFFCTKAISGRCAASSVGASFAVGVNAGAVPFGFYYDQSGGTGHTLLNGGRDDTNGAYLAQIGLGTTANAGPGPVAYLGLSDLPYPGDQDFQDLTLSVTVVPEPASLLLMGTGVLVLGLAALRRRKG